MGDWFYTFFTMAMLTLLEVFATACLTRWAYRIDETGLAVGCGLFSLIGFMLGHAIRHVGHMSVVNALWQSTSIAGVALLSYVLFEENITPRQAMGMGLAVTASLCFV